ncbi:LAGLIDADG family homing endonuclease [Candidatus Pacearchaeota archaeon]|nr:LAGLIDADG family homing endonuclease [Candidatus Pacearchaeota archaeon]
MKSINISRESLEDLYKKDKLSTYEIAEEFGCCQATIWKRLVEFDIKRRKPHELNSNVPTKEKLIELYFNKRLSTWRIEKEYGYSRGTIYRKLKEFGLKTRDLADSHIIYPRQNFSGDPIEKAYLIGFRIGDLGVRKIYPNSKTICVASGSTIKEQIDLIKSLFEKYGKTWIQTKNGKINIQINLNESFEFLLSKDVPKWALDKEDYFFSFLAGFTDAEGSFYISKGMAAYSIGNCDFNLLSIIKKNLNRFGISCGRISTHKRKGKPTTDGYFFSSDYYQLRIDKKAVLLQLFTKLKTFIKHENKMKALNIATENINWRNLKYGK